MRFVPSSFNCLCGGVALAASVGACSARAAGGSASPGQSIEFSNPRSDTLLTNVDQLDKETRGERDFDAASSRTETFSAPGGGFSAPMPWPSPSAGVVVQRHSKNPFGVDDDSQSLAPEETLRKMLIRDLLKTPYDEPDDDNNASADKQASPTKRLYDQFSSTRPESPNKLNSSDSFWPRTRAGNRTDTSDDGDPGSRQDDSAITISSPNRLLGLDPGWGFSSRAEKPNGLSDLFGPRDNRIDEMEQLLENKRAEEIQKRQIEDYKAMVGYSPTPLYDFAQLTPSPARTALSSGNSAIPVAPDPYNPFALAPSTVNPTLDPGLLAPVPPQAPVPSSLSPIPFASSPPKASAPKPIFSIPQRAF